MTNAGGVGLFIKSHLKFHLTHQYNLKACDCEDIWVEIQCSFPSTSTLVLGVIYRHPCQAVDSFLECLDMTLSELNNDRKTFVIMGDININLLAHSQSCTKLLDVLESHATIPVITNPTRVTNSCSNLLDHIYTNITNFTLSPMVLHDCLTDHYPILCHISRLVPIVENASIFHLA